jgi:hypothetical protein
MRVNVAISDKKVSQKINGYVRYALKCMANTDTGFNAKHKKGPSQAGHGYLTERVGLLLISYNIADFMGCIFT